MLMTCATGADRARRSIRGVFGLYMAMVWVFTGHAELGEMGLLSGVVHCGFSWSITNLGGTLIGLLCPELR